jgi:hypothetical protein
MGPIRQWLVIVAAIASLRSYAFDLPPTGGDAQSTNQTAGEHWSSFLPLMKEEALARGYDLPLPFGVSLIYNYLARDISVSDVRIGINGEPPHSASRFLDLGSNSKVNAALIKADAWLLPFLNVYVLGGYINNQSTSQGHVTIPRPGPRPGPPLEFDFTVPTTLSGFVGGAGLSLAAGYKQFFVMADANYSKTDIGFDNRFRALVASARTGWNGKIGSVPTRLWLGAAYWDTENTATSTVMVPDVGTVSFEADQGPRHPWNMILGGSVVLGRHWESFLECGFNFDDVKIVATGLTFRF